MSFTEVLDELSTLTFAQRQQLIQCAVEMDDLGLTPGQLALVDERRAAHRSHPETAVEAAVMKSRLRERVAR